MKSPLNAAKTRPVKPREIFEPATRAQIEMIFALVRERSISREKLYAGVERLIGIPSIRALGKNEAVYIIEKLLGDTKWVRPPPPRHAGRIPGETANMPSYKMICAIRAAFKTLGWEKHHIQNWLLKYHKVESVRELNRETARKAFIGLSRIRKTRKQIQD